MFKQSLFILVSLLVAGNVALADFGTKRHQGKWDKRHPRQAEVNGRLQNQENRVKEGEANGTLTKDEGKKIEKEDRKIFRQEKRMKERNGGNYLTKGQQEKLNKEENAVSGEIKKDEAGKTPVPAASPAN